MSEQQGKQSAHTEQGEQVLDADLAQHLGLLDWSQLDPIGAGQTLTGAENEPGFFGDLGDDLLDDEGTDEETQVSEEDRDPSEGDTTVQRRRGGSAEDQATAAVVTTGQRSRSPSQGGRGLPSVTTGHVASGRGRNISSRTRSRGRISGSRSGGSSGSGTQAQGPSTEPTEPSGSGESKGMKRKAAPNLDEIEDPAERRKQRRLAKNRATAAVSRERKRVQMVQLAGRTRALEQENANLQFMLGLRDQEIARLREDLASLPRGAGGSAENPVNAVTSPTEPAALTGTAPPIHPPRSRARVGPPGAPLEQLSSTPGSNPRSLSGEEALGIRAGDPGGSFQGVEIGEQGGSWAGSTQDSRSLPAMRGGLILGQPAALAARVMSGTVPGVVVGVDGQWLRLRAPHSSAAGAAPEAPGRGASRDAGRERNAPSEGQK